MNVKSGNQGEYKNQIFVAYVNSVILDLTSTAMGLKGYCRDCSQLVTKAGVGVHASLQGKTHSAEPLAWCSLIARLPQHPEPGVWGPDFFQGRCSE